MRTLPDMDLILAYIHNIHLSFIFINSTGELQFLAHQHQHGAFQTNEHNVKANRGKWSGIES